MKEFEMNSFLDWLLEGTEKNAICILKKQKYLVDGFSYNRDVRSLDVKISVSLKSIGVAKK